MQNRLKKVRKALDIKQREVAERLGVGVGLVGQWECGITPMPDVRIYQFCNEYNVNEKWLRTGEGEMFDKPDAKLLETFSDEDLLTESMKRTVVKLPPDLQKLFFRVCEKFAAGGAVEDVTKMISEHKRR